MDTMLKLAVLAVLSAVMCLLLRQNEMSLALVFSVLACTLILLIGIRFLQPVLSVIKQLEDLSGLEKGATQPLFKVVGIGVLTQIAGSVCRDADEGSLAKSVEIAGTFLAIYASLPLLNAVLSLVEKLIGGAL